MGWYGGEVHRISHISDPRDVLRDTESFPPRVDRVFLDGLFFFSLPTPSDYTRIVGRERESEREGGKVFLLFPARSVRWMVCNVSGLFLWVDFFARRCKFLYRVVLIRRNGEEKKEREK